MEVVTHGHSLTIMLQNTLKRHRYEKSLKLIFRNSEIGFPLKAITHSGKPKG